MKRLDEFKKRKGVEEDPEDSLNDDTGIAGGGGGGGGGEAVRGNATKKNSTQGGGGAGVALGGSAFEVTKATSEVDDGRGSKVRATCCTRSALGEET